MRPAGSLVTVRDHACKRAGRGTRAGNTVTRKSGGSQRYVQARHDRSRWALQAVRVVSGRPGRLVLHPQGRGRRLPRSQRGGQDDHDAALDRLRGADARLGPDRRHRRPDRPDPRGRAPGLPARERAALPRHDPHELAPLLRRSAGHVAGSAHDRGRRRGRASAPWNRSRTSRSASCPRAIASGSPWPRRCCTTPRS